MSIHDCPVSLRVEAWYPSGPAAKRTSNTSCSSVEYLHGHDSRLWMAWVTFKVHGAGCNDKRDKTRIALLAAHNGWEVERHGLKPWLKLRPVAVDGRKAALPTGCWRPVSYHHSSRNTKIANLNSASSLLARMAVGFALRCAKMAALWARVSAMFWGLLQV